MHLHELIRFHELHFDDICKHKPGHWKATGQFFEKFIWKILYKHLDLAGRVQGEHTVPRPFMIPIAV